MKRKKNGERLITQRLIMGQKLDHDTLDKEKYTQL